MPLLSRLAARVESSLEFVIQGQEISISRSKIASLKSILRDSAWYTSLAASSVSEPPSLNPFATLCPYYNSTATCCCLKSKSLFARLRISNSRTAGRQPVTAGIIDQNSAHHLTACCPQLPWQVRRLDHSNSWRIDFFSRSFTPVTALFVFPSSSPFPLPPNSSYLALPR